MPFSSKILPVHPRPADCNGECIEFAVQLFGDAGAPCAVVALLHLESLNGSGIAVGIVYLHARCVGLRRPEGKMCALRINFQLEVVAGIYGEVCVLLVCHRTAERRYRQQQRSRHKIVFQFHSFILVNHKSLRRSRLNNIMV